MAAQAIWAIEDPEVNQVISINGSAATRKFAGRIKPLMSSVHVKLDWDGPSGRLHLTDLAANVGTVLERIPDRRSVRIRLRTKTSRINQGRKSRIDNRR